MDKLIAVIRPQRAGLVCERLHGAGLVTELSAVEVMGSNREVAKRLAASFAVEALPMVAVEGLVDRRDRAAVVEVICSTCRTGRAGDGKIFFLGPIDEIVC